MTETEIETYIETQTETQTDRYRDNDRKGDESEKKIDRLYPSKYGIGQYMELRDKVK